MFKIPPFTFQRVEDQINHDTICPPLFSLIFGSTRYFTLKRCQSVTIGCDTRLFSHQISTRDMTTFYGDRNFTTELVTGILFPRFFCDLQVTMTDWEKGDFLEPNDPDEPMKGMIIFYSERFALTRAPLLHRFLERKTNLKDSILITGPSRFIQYYNMRNNFGIPERSSLISLTFSGERVKMAMLSLKLLANDDTSIQKKFFEFKESLDFEAESNGLDQYTFGLVFIHGNSSFDYCSCLKSLFPKVVFIESVLKNSNESSQIYGDLIDKIREDPPPFSSKSEPERIFEKFPHTVHPDGKISLVIINLMR